MRRTQAALALVTLVAVSLAGPLATAGSSGAPPIRCAADRAPSPECALLDQLADQLAPLAPVLALGGPAMEPLTTAIGGLTARADEPGGVPAATVAEQAQALLDQVAVLPPPIRALLAAAQLDGLTVTLEALLAQLAPVTDAVAAPLGGTTPAPSGPSGPAPSADGDAPPAASASGAAEPPLLGGSLSAAGVGEATRTTSSSALPDVPVGDPLTLAPLALPDFGFSSTIGLDAATDVAAEVTTGSAVAEVQLAADAALSRASEGGGGPEVAVVAGLSILLLGAAFASQAHQNRRTIPD